MIRTPLKIVATRIIVLCVGLGLVPTAFAAQGDLTVTGAPAAAQCPGNEFTLTYSVDVGSEPVKVASGRFRLIMDSASFELAGVNVSGGMVPALDSWSVAGVSPPAFPVSPDANNRIALSTASSSTALGSGNRLLIALQIKVKSGVTDGSRAIQFEFREPLAALNSANEPRDIAVTPSTASTAVVLSATCQEPRRTLTLASSPANGGSIAASPAPGTDGKYANGTEVTLTATASPGFSFGSWSGGATGSTNSVKVTMDADKAVTVIFTTNPPRRTLTLASSPANGGSIAASPAPGTDGKYANGTEVTLTATASPGFSFGSWSGDATGSTNPVKVTMDADKAVTVNFTTNPPRRTLTLASSPANGGSIAASPAPGTDGKYANGTEVTLTATASPGFSFGSWSGGATGSTNPVKVTMDADKAVTAVFIKTTVCIEPPDGVAATDAGEFNSFDPVTITWSPVSGAVAYRVYRTTTSTFDKNGFLGQTTGAEFEDDTAENGLDRYTGCFGLRQQEVPTDDLVIFSILGCWRPLPEHISDGPIYFYWVTAVDANNCESEPSVPDTGNLYKSAQKSTASILTGDSAILLAMLSTLMATAAAIRQYRRAR
jgi:hypothetical protein